MDDFDEYLKNNYISEYDYLYNKSYITKWIVNDNTTVVNAKFINEESKSYLEDLIIFYQNEEKRYSFVKYETINQTFSNSFIKKVVNKFDVEKEKADYSSCIKKDNTYNCEFVIDSLDKKVLFNIDASKYKDESEIKIKDYTPYFKYDNNSGVMILLGLSNDLDVDINNLKLFSSFTKSTITIDNKTIDKYYIKTEEGHLADYIINLDNNISIMLTVTNESIDMLDVLAKDFMNFKIVDL